MATLLHRGLAQTVPQGPVTIDGGHPLAQGLTSCALLRGRQYFWDYARGLLVFNTSNFFGGRAVQAETPLGPATTSSADGGFEPTWPVMDSNPIGPLAMMTVQVGAFSKSTHSGDYVGLKDSPADGKRFAFSTTGFDFGAVADRVSYSGAPAFLPVHMAASGGPAGNKAYRNGVLLGSAGSATSRTLTASEQVRIGSCAFGGTFNGYISYVFIWNRQLSAPEIKWAAAEPYAFLVQGVHRRIFLMGQGTVTISGAGASTLAGFTASAAGAETITGTAASTLAGCTGSAAGAETDPGTSSGTLAGFTSSAAGASTFSGSLGVTLDGVTDAAAGAETITGSASITLAGFTCRATNVAHGGSAAATMSQLHGASASVIQLHNATATVTEDS